MSAADSLELAKMQVERQEQDRQDDADDCQRRDGEKRKLRDGREAQLEDALGDGHNVVLPLDCQTAWTAEV